MFGTGASTEAYYRTQLAAQGEAKILAGRMPTKAELYVLDLSEADARGMMAVFQMNQTDNEANDCSSTTQANADVILNDETTSHAINGARITDIESPAAETHANQYYGLVRSMKTDVRRIAKNTGYSENEIQRIKDYIFFEEHDLGDAMPRRFDPSFAMAQSWQRLIAGTPESHDITMLKHEILEKELMDAGMSQYEAHIEASKKFNYAKESDKYYASFEKN